MSHLEEKLLIQIRHERLPEPEREIRFSNTRKWRIDFGWPDLMLAVEVEGGTWTNGRHSRGSGFRKDCEKYNQLSMDGWTLLRFTPGMISEGEAILTIGEAIKQRREQI